ncbi:MAG: Aminoacyl-tRNA hydrolase, peptidyl-tRNA hydrolase, family [Candidatus Kaiserbacteria bacterium]|nr:Aminoacyl-tRNA hydrolase, peptidyl-tRNA hydrolase, family [Candidatus Kaiserbacteria bacterium]
MSFVVVGLGNPGEEYTNTRHNTGRMAVESFARTCEEVNWKQNAKAKATVTKAVCDGTSVMLVLPDTFMNKSGLAVMAYVKSVNAAAQLVVVYDDLDLPLGVIKISFDRGSGGHKGIESIARTLKTKAFVRIRVGVSPSTAGGKLKKPSGEDDVVDFILGKFKPSEAEALKQLFKKTNEALHTIVTKGYVAAMNACN